jgi:hypothetical protein
MRNYSATAAAVFLAMAASMASAQSVTINACGTTHRVEIKPAPLGVDPKLAAYLGAWSGVSGRPTCATRSS